MVCCSFSLTFLKRQKITIPEHPPLINNRSLFQTMPLQEEKIKSVPVHRLTCFIWGKYSNPTPSRGTLDEIKLSSKCCHTEVGTVMYGICLPALKIAVWPTHSSLFKVTVQFFGLCSKVYLHSAVQVIQVFTNTGIKPVQSLRERIKQNKPIMKNSHFDFSAFKTVLKSSITFF